MFTQYSHRLVAVSRARSGRVGFRPGLEFLESRALLNAGTLDPSFGNGGIVLSFPTKTDTATYAALQPDGKLLQVGEAPNGDIVLVRYNPDGTPDTTFGTGGEALSLSGTASAIAVQPDGKILVAGSLHNTSFDVLRFNPAGTLDPGFGTGGVSSSVPAPPAGSSAATGLLVLPDGRIVVGGQQSVPVSLPAPGTEYQNELVALHPDGTLDPSFGGTIEVSTGGNPLVAPRSLVLGLDGKIVLATDRVIRVTA
jgi:uncharacterized delta-60 repeat protein